eukprot:358290-Chlamydomonas_euryale.AAC.2
MAHVAAGASEYRFMSPLYGAPLMSSPAMRPSPPSCSCTHQLFLVLGWPRRPTAAPPPAVAAIAKVLAVVVVACATFGWVRLGMSLRFSLIAPCSGALSSRGGGLLDCCWEAVCEGEGGLRSGGHVPTCTAENFCKLANWRCSVLLSASLVGALNLSVQLPSPHRPTHPPCTFPHPRPEPAAALPRAAAARQARAPQRRAPPCGPPRPVGRPRPHPVLRSRIGRDGRWRGSPCGVATGATQAA